MTAISTYVRVMGLIASGLIANPAPAGQWFIGAGAGSADYAEPNTETAWTAFAGYRLSRFASAEIGYWDLGRIRNDGIRGYLMGHDRDLRQTYLRAHAHLPVSGALSLTAGVGVARSDHRLTNVRDGAGTLPPRIFPAVYLSPQPYDDETNFTWAAGVTWNAKAGLGLRATWSDHGFDGFGQGEGELSVLSLSAIWTF